MGSDINHYSAGMSYENFLRRLTAPSRAVQTQCAGEMQHLLAIEDGSAKRIKGQPSEAKWLEGIKKKVLRAFDKLLKRKTLVGTEREYVEQMRGKVSGAQSGHEVMQAIEATWPIVHAIIPNGM